MYTNYIIHAYNNKLRAHVANRHEAVSHTRTAQTNTVTRSTQTDTALTRTCTDYYEPDSVALPRTRTHTDTQTRARTQTCRHAHAHRYMLACLHAAPMHTRSTHAHMHTADNHEQEAAAAADSVAEMDEVLRLLDRPGKVRLGHSKSDWVNKRQTGPVKVRLDQGKSDSAR
jgi:hypothetical protein